MRLLRGLILVLGLVLICAFGAIAWLVEMPPRPRVTAAWTLGPEMLSARGELATAVGYSEPCATPPCPDAERLYVLGGLSRLFRPDDRVEIYDARQMLWSAGPSLPAPRHHFAAARLGQDLYVSGGTNIAGVGLGHQHWPAMDNLWRLRPGASRWEAITPMIEPRWGHRMVAHDGRLYVVGGRGGSARTLIYTPGKEWTTGADLPRLRDHLSVVVAGGRIFAIGGRDPRSISSVDIYDPSGDFWKTGPDLPQSTSGAAEAVFDDVIFIFGGEEPSFIDGRVNDQHWKLDTRVSTPRWEPVPKPPLAVHGTDGTVLDGMIAIAGGSSRHGVFSVAGWTSALQLFRVRP